MQPFVNFSDMKDMEIESKITDLGKKYFMTHNPSVQMQIASLLDAYKDELSLRRHNEWQKMMDKSDKGLDKLININ